MNRCRISMSVFASIICHPVHFGKFRCLIWMFLVFLFSTKLFQLSSSTDIAQRPGKAWINEQFKIKYFCGQKCLFRKKRPFKPITSIKLEGLIFKLAEAVWQSRDYKLHLTNLIWFQQHTKQWVCPFLSLKFPL